MEQSVINAIRQFYLDNDVRFDYAVTFDYLLEKTQFTDEQLNKILKHFNDKGYLSGITWADDIVAEFYLSRKGFKLCGFR